MLNEKIENLKKKKRRKRFGDKNVRGKWKIIIFISLQLFFLNLFPFSYFF